MTLQQKMLAKQSKKGFTLVELVVVIAILAILAAIAIPAVVGIINNANQSAGASDASSVNNACKTFYSGIRSGSIVNTDKDPNGSTVSAAASAGASDKVKLDKAKAATVADAQRYSGLNVSYDNLCYISNPTSTQTKGTIEYYDGTSTGLNGRTSLTASTTMANLYGAGN